MVDRYSPRDLDESTSVRVRFSIDISAKRLGEVLKNLSIYAVAEDLKLTVDSIHYDNPTSELKTYGDF